MTHSLKIARALFDRREPVHRIRLGVEYGSNVVGDGDIAGLNAAFVKDGHEVRLF